MLWDTTLVHTSWLYTNSLFPLLTTSPVLACWSLCVVAFARAAVIGWQVSPCEPPSHCSQVRNCTSHSIKALACYCCALAPVMLFSRRESDNFPAIMLSQPPSLPCEIITRQHLWKLLAQESTLAGAVFNEYRQEIIIMITQTKLYFITPCWLFHTESFKSVHAFVGAISSRPHTTSSAAVKVGVMILSSDDHHSCNDDCSAVTSSGKITSTRWHFASCCVALALLLMCLLPRSTFGTRRLGAALRKSCARSTRVSLKAFFIDHCSALHSRVFVLR